MREPQQAWVELVALDWQADQEGREEPALPFMKVPYADARGALKYLDDDGERVRIAYVQRFVFPFTPATCVHPVRFAVPDWMGEALALRLIGKRMGIGA